MLVDSMWRKQTSYTLTLALGQSAMTDVLLYDPRRRKPASWTRYSSAPGTISNAYHLIGPYQ